LVATGAIKPPTACIHSLHDRNPIAIALAGQSTPVLDQEGVYLKHPITAEGRNTPPEQEGKQIRDYTKLRSSRGRPARVGIGWASPRRIAPTDFNQMPWDFFDLLRLGDHSKLHFMDER